MQQQTVLHTTFYLAICANVLKKSELVGFRDIFKKDYPVLSAALSKWVDDLGELMPESFQQLSYVNFLKLYRNLFDFLIHAGLVVNDEDINFIVDCNKIPAIIAAFQAEDSEKISICKDLFHKHFDNYEDKISQQLQCAFAQILNERMPRLSTEVVARMERYRSQFLAKLTSNQVVKKISDQLNSIGSIQSYRAFIQLLVNYDQISLEQKTKLLSGLGNFASSTKIEEISVEMVLAFFDIKQTEFRCLLQVQNRLTVLNAVLDEQQQPVIQAADDKEIASKTVRFSF